MPHGGQRESRVQSRWAIETWCAAWPANRNNGSMIRFGSCAVDIARRSVVRDDIDRHLEPQAFDLLAYLLTHKDRVVPKIELLDEVWGDQFVSESALTTRIKEIRAALGDNGTRQAVVKNFRGRGYRFVADIDAETLSSTLSGDAATKLAQRTLAQSTGAPRAAQFPLRLQPRTVQRRAGEPIAYATIGAGPPLVFMPGWISSLDAFSDGTDPRGALVARLANDFAVTIFDRYGTGLSTAADVDTSLAASADEVRAILGVVDDQATLVASSAAGPAALLAAAGNPAVGRLVMICTYANGSALFTNAQNNANMVDLVEQSWGTGSRIIADMIVPGIDAVTRSVFARFQRRTATPDVAAGYIRQLFTADATPVLARIEQRCLIMHYRDDSAIPFDGARQLALGIDDTELVPLDGPYHTPPPQDIEHVAATIGRFIERA